MEVLEDEFSRLTIGGQTGLLFDFEQLKHKSLKQHVECPALEVINKLTPADRSVIEGVHNEAYINFVETMWPEETKKREIYISDTYFNEHTKHAAYLGAGAVTLAVDKIIEARQWKNALCVIRPPGHHSGHKNVCSGFCFFNNVAVGARYVQSKYGIKKVLIFDWDIHHGDGTQSIFNDDPSVLFVSIHRHDDGAFYPQSGSVENQGEGEGKGFSVNIPWDIGYADDALKAGTDEYIYAFERIVRPIVEEFQPEFIFISAGFDSAQGDPLGQCKLTYEGYAYMTNRLMDLMKGKNVIACLEGGYNLESISWGAESVLRTLIEEKFPLEKCARQMSMDALMASVSPNSVGVSAVKQTIAAYKDQWKCLGEFGESAYDLRILENIRQNSLISAGHAKDFIMRGHEILKKSKKGELGFYKDFVNPESKYAAENKRLVEFIPKVIGFESIDGWEYVVLENLTHGRQKASIVDFKIGKHTLHKSYREDKTKSQAKKDASTTSNVHGYRVSGVIFKDALGVPENNLPSRSALTQFKHKDVVECIKKIFTSNQAKLMNLIALEAFVKFLEGLIAFFTHDNTRQFVSSSIVIIVDNTTEEGSHAFKLIDFNYVDELGKGEKDENILFGLQNMFAFTKAILEQQQAAQKKLAAAAKAKQ